MSTIYLKPSEPYVLRLRNGDQVTAIFVDAVQDGSLLRFVFSWSFSLTEIHPEAILSCVEYNRLEEPPTIVRDNPPHEFVVLPEDAIHDALDTPDNLPSFKVWYRDQVTRGLIKEEEESNADRMEVRVDDDHDSRPD